MMIVDNCVGYFGINRIGVYTSVAQSCDWFVSSSCESISCAGL